MENYSIHDAFRELKDVIDVSKDPSIDEKMKQNRTKKLIKLDKILSTATLNEDTDNAFSVYSKSDMEKAKEFINDDDNDSEIIVDADAETANDLKKSYVNNFIIECPVCHTLYYKEPDELIKDEENTSSTDEPLYNVGEECSVCNNKDGYTLIGKVAKVDDSATDDNDDTINNDTKLIDEKDTASKDSDEDEASTDEVDDDKQQDDSSQFSEGFSFDKSSLGLLIEKYLKNVYENINSFNLLNIKPTKTNLIVEGLIKFKDSKLMSTKFSFNEMRHGKNFKKVSFYGLNEQFSNKNAFILTTESNKNDNKLYSSCLSYNYSINESLVSGRVKLNKHNLIMSEEVAKELNTFESLSTLMENYLSKDFLLRRKDNYHKDMSYHDYFSKLNESYNTLKNSKQQDVSVVEVYKNAFKE